MSVCLYPLYIYRNSDDISISDKDQPQYTVNLFWAVKLCFPPKVSESIAQGETKSDEQHIYSNRFVSLFTILGDDERRDFSEYY